MEGTATPKAIARVLVAWAASFGWAVGCSPAPPRPAPPYTAAHASLLASYEGEFPFEPRLSGSGGVPGEEQSSARRGVLAFAGDGLDRRVISEAEIEREMAESPSLQARAAAGVRSLLNSARDGAVRTLEAARLDRPDDPRLLNDLAAAYLVRGLEEDRPLDLLDALSLTAEGVLSKGAGPEVRFNHAYTLSSLHLREAARAAWEDYLQVDPTDSMWSEIARRHLKDLTEPLMYERWPEDRRELRRAAASGDSEEVRALVRAFPVEVLGEAEAWLFEEWSAAVEQRNPATKKSLRHAIRVVGEELPAGGGGELILAALNHLESLESEGAEDRLAGGYAALAKGNAALERLEPGQARAPLEAALHELSALGTPYAPRAHLLAAVCRFHDTSYEEATSLARAALEASLRTADLETTIRSLQLLGLIESVEYRFGAALRRYDSALEKAREAEWRGAGAATAGLIGEVYALLGDERTSWRYRLVALKDAEAIQRARIRARILNDVTHGAKRYGLEVSRYFAEELVRAATESGLPVAVVVALEQRASIAALAGEPISALADLDEAETWVEPLTDPVLAETLRGNLLRTRGGIMLADSPAGALPVLDEAVEAYRSTRYEVGLPWVLRLRAQALRALGRRSEASADLELALRKATVAAVELSDPQQRMDLARDTRPIYDELVDLQLRAGEYKAALSTLERSRWRVADRMVSSLQSSGSVGRHLPQDTAVVVYRALPDRLVIWVLKRGLLISSEVPKSREELSRIVGRTRHSLLLGSSDELTEPLYRILIEPVAPSLEGMTRLVVVPDGPLHAVPFSALRCPSSGRYLLEDFQIEVSRSVADSIGASDQAATGFFTRSTAVLAVGNPATAPELQIPRLPQAETEVLAIQRHFPRTTLLLGEEASEDRLLDSLAHHEILHIAGHVLDNEGRPLLSSVVLSPSREADGLLLAHELLEQDLGHLRLVVLSSCSSIREDGGSINVGEAFLEAGAPLVLASLWDVADRVGAEVFGRFYEALSHGVSPAIAIHSVQKEFLASPDPVLSDPATWAGFQLLYGAWSSEIELTRSIRRAGVSPSSDT